PYDHSSVSTSFFTDTATTEIYPLSLHDALPISGSALEVDFGDGYDTILLTNILHHFDVAGCEQILRKVHRALAPGGRALTVEFVPDPSRVAPPEAAGFALTMLALTPAGDAYTFAEYERMFRNAGFARSELHDLAPSPQRAVISYR